MPLSAKKLPCPSVMRSCDIMVIFKLDLPRKYEKERFKNITRR
ncbi:MAG: hypothetical protein ACI828_000534 [Flavobacteriales bacterium]|jgi:hypothetical protein